MGAAGWPETAEALAIEQARLAAADPDPWAHSPGDDPIAAGAFVCFPRGLAGAGARGDPAWAAAASVHGARLAAVAAVSGTAGAPYRPGLLALREGPLLEAAMRALPSRHELLVVNATGRDHPRLAGLALHLGAVLGVPSIGVTDRPLVAHGPLPPDQRGATSPLSLDGAVVALWVRARSGARPLVAHAGWRTEAEAAAALVLAMTRSARTPEPIRHARRVARLARIGRERA
jgi:deoxyribonuclease V